MFKQMRKMERKMPDHEINDVLKSANYGHLGLNLPSGYPYSVPVNYVMIGDDLYIHCANEGQKIDAVEFSDKASFSIVHSERVVKSKFTSAYESVIAFGKIEILQMGPRHREVLTAFIDKYSQDFKETGYAYVDRAYNKTTILKFTIEHVEGKKNVRTED